MPQLGVGWRESKFLRSEREGKRLKWLYTSFLRVLILLWTEITCNFPFEGQYPVHFLGTLFNIRRVYMHTPMTSYLFPRYETNEQRKLKKAAITMTTALSSLCSMSKGIPHSYRSPPEARPTPKQAAAGALLRVCMRSYSQQLHAAHHLQR